MRFLVPLLAVAAGGFAGVASANDSMASLGAGGLEFFTTQDVEMASEDLFVSPDRVKVVYQFKNDAKTDQHALIAFPMPDITGDGDFTVAIPTEDLENIFGFKTVFDGKPVDAVLHQYAFAAGIDESDYLRRLASRSRRLARKRRRRSMRWAMPSISACSSSAWSCRWNTTPETERRPTSRRCGRYGRLTAGRPTFLPARLSPWCTATSQALAVRWQRLSSRLLPGTKTAAPNIGKNTAQTTTCCGR